MKINKLILHNFRNISKAEIEFHPQLNILYGDNAQGKTAVLEAIYLLMTGRSFRASHPAELIRIGAPSLCVEAYFTKDEITQHIKIVWTPEERKIFYNRALCPTAAALFGGIQGVILTPDDAEIIKGSPAVRRQFLDMQIAQIDPLYIHFLTRFHRAMKHRNVLLKAKRTESIESWEHEMGQAADYIVTCRQKNIVELAERCQIAHHALNTKGELLAVHYKSSLSGENVHARYSGQLQRNRPREMQLGYTLTGPHREDLEITINDKDSRSFASEGQQRSCVAALRLAQWEQIRRRSNDLPIMMVDDVGLSLDSQRKTKLLHNLGGLGQVFVTTTEAHEQAWEGYPHALHYVQQGKITTRP